MNLISFILDCLFPPLCCHCQKIGSLLCDKCYGQLEFSHAITETDDLISIQSCTQYGEVSSDIIHTLKYQSVKNVAHLCAQIMYMTSHLPETDLITSVPLHPKRQAQRGFNQAELIAIELCKLCKLPYYPLLLRTKETINFAKVTDKIEREALTENLFEANPLFIEKAKNKSVLLVDDVWTTGATIKAVAKIITNVSSQKLFALTFTHGS